MISDKLGGYAGKILRIDLTAGQIRDERFDEPILRKHLGGTGLGAKLLYEEVPPGVEWNDSSNRLIWATGPLAGTKVPGSGTFSVVTKGPMTNFAAATQANGFFGAYLKFSGFDGIVIQGAAEEMVYLYIHDGVAELRDARHLAGMDTWEIGSIIAKELGEDERWLSVFGIGPAGESLVRFAGIFGDKGHAAAHNGVGAVMGSKNLKAIAVKRGKSGVPVRDPQLVGRLAKEIYEDSTQDIVLCEWGTAGYYSIAHRDGWLPVKNYATNIFPEHQNLSGQYLRRHFEVKPKPCWACRIGHVHGIRVTGGPYKDYEGEEPEYEGMAAMGSVIGQTDPGAAVMLCNLIDRLGMDINETGWVMAWVMECYEKGLLTDEDTDGIKMTWGNAEAVQQMLHKIAQRDGFGDILAEGVKRAAERIGDQASDFAIYTKKGASPRGHDHRAMWDEMLDTCVGNTGTIEGTGGHPAPEQLGLPPITDPFSPEAVSWMNAKLNGRRQFEDSLGYCRFCVLDLNLAVAALNAVTGWDFDVEEAMDVGRRTVNLLRAFAIRHGVTPDLEAPSARYGSIPVDGPMAGKSVLPHWDSMIRNYYQTMGWDTETGKPLPTILKRLGLENIIEDIWR